MAYSDFTFSALQQQFHLTIAEQGELFADVPDLVTSAFLQALLEENIPLALAISTEKARSELLIMPILVELRKLLQRRIGLFSGVDFPVDPACGLNGVCDFIITRSPQQLFISKPVLMVVEAKNDNIKGGLAQCIAEMVAAQRFNASEGQEGGVIAGVVTTGSNWKFLQLDANQVRLDQHEYFIDQVGRILAILRYLVV